MSVYQSLSLLLFIVIAFYASTHGAGYAVAVILLWMLLFK